MKALLWALGLNGSFLFIEAGVGWWTNSLALLSDAVHMLGDVAALILAVAAARLARRKAAEHQTFGLVRAEVIGAFLNGIFLLAACLWIIIEGVKRLDAPPDIPGLPMLIVGGVGLLINLGSAWGLWRSDHSNLNIRGALVHMLADALGSVGAMIAAFGVMAGFWIADPLASLFIAALVLYGAWGVLRDSGRVLLQLPPRYADVPNMRQALEELDKVCCVHDLHVWTLDGNKPIVTMHLVADPAARPVARELLRRDFGVEHATLQIEQEHCGAKPCAPMDLQEHDHSHRNRNHDYHG